jgi:hypothetical protein
MMPTEPDDLELALGQRGAVADYCRAAHALQCAECRCSALGVHPRGAMQERSKLFGDDGADGVGDAT